MMKKIIALFAALCATLLCATTPAFSQTNPGVRAADSSGTMVSLPKAAIRVVSLSPASTEILFTVGATVVGDTTYCIYPPEALNVTKIGGFSASSMSIEKILSLKPDLVVSSGSIHKPVTDELARYGIPSFAFAPNNFDEISSGIRAIGLLTGRREAAALLASTMMDKITKVRNTVAVIPVNQRLTVFWEIYDEPLMTCGSATFQHAIVEAAGGRDIFSDLPGSWPRVSAEEVIKRAPQVIMGADDHGDKLSIASISARPGWNLVPAVRSGRIALLPTYLVSGPGPRIADGVLLAAKALYPRLFP